MVNLEEASYPGQMDDAAILGDDFLWQRRDVDIFRRTVPWREVYRVRKEKRTCSTYALEDIRRLRRELAPRTPLG